tara:strand:- start:4870 stop:8274 length:3405 start_codon:yes stop_codon:yes gene_type:complete
MSVDRFRFVSPGVFINEIDKSQIQGPPALGAGPVVVGVAKKGPALVPVTVSTYADFVDLFGAPEPGSARNNDPWRNGNKSNPMYGAYAAQAYLTNGAPLTYVRLVGDQDPQKNSGGEAGWQVPTVSKSNEGGAYGLFIAGDGSVGTMAEAMLAAVFYTTGSAGTGTTGGPTITLSGTVEGLSANGAMAATLIKPATVGASTNQEFRVRISGSRQGVQETTFNFNPKSGRYIRKVFNTNPTLLNDKVTATSNLQDYFLGQSYENAVVSFVTTFDDQQALTRTNFSGTVACILSLNSGSDGSTGWGGNFRTNYKVPSTPWIVAQDLSDNSASFDVNSTVEPLFRVHAREGVEYSQKNYKVSISDIKASPNAQFEPYGSFSLLIRGMQDTDENPVILEQFNNLNLDPTSNNFISKRIGDRSFSWDTVNKKWNVDGQYDVRSKYVRVECTDLVEAGGQEAALIPFGFKGVPTWRGFTAVSGSTIEDYSLLGTGGVSRSVVGEAAGTGSIPAGALPAIGSIPADSTSQVQISAAAAAAATVTIAGLPTTSRTITITNTAGLSKAYIAAAAQDLTVDPPAFANVTSNAAVATSLAACINNVANGHGTTITVADDGAGVLSLTQAVAGADGNVTITSTSGDVTLAGFTGGADGPRCSAFSSVMPVLPMRASSADGRLMDITNAFFGMTTNQAAGTLVFDGSVLDVISRQPEGLAAGSLILSPGFSMDDLVYSAAAGTATHSGSDLGLYFDTIAGGTSVSDASSNAVYRGTPQGGRRAGTACTAVSGSYTGILDRGYDRFTLPLYGGFDGFDILERNPFNDARALGATNDAKSTKDYPMYYTLLKAIDSVSDVDQININMAAIPGISDRQTTNKLMSMAEERKDTLAIIDLESGFQPVTEGSSTGPVAFNSRRGSSANTVTSIQNRDLNTSYACAYYPWVQINDTVASTRVWVPPSTVALGVMASSAARAELWFAPAGFNRGGLNNGNAGLNVINVVEKLTAKQRDNLYEVNINPIASFPSEGIVVFGQKTLQATPSALDRINVRRLMIYLRKQITIISNGILFDPNVQITWNRFINRVDPFLGSIQQRFGLSDYRVILDSNTTTPDLVDRNIMYAKILLKPTRAIEFIALDFVITRSGVEF